MKKLQRFLSMLILIVLNTYYSIAKTVRVNIEIREKVYFLVVRRTLRHILKEMECSRDERVLSQRSIFQ